MNKLEKAALKAQILSTPRKPIDTIQIVKIMMFLATTGWQHDTIDTVFNDTAFNMHKSKKALKTFMQETAKVEKAFTDYDIEDSIYSYAMQQATDFNQFYEDIVSCFFSISDKEKTKFMQLFHDTVNKLREGNKISFDADLKNQLLSLQ
jgi:hypothetical protein